MVRFWAAATVSLSLVAVACSSAPIDDGVPKVAPGDCTPGDDGCDAPPVTKKSDNTPPPPPVTACTPSSCPTGCCSATNECFTDHAVTHCATGGYLCPAACAPGMTCNASGTTFACTAPPPKVAGHYDVTLASGQLETADSAYVNSGAVGALKISRTKTVNGPSPVWNAALGTLVGSTLIGTVVTLDVKHEISFSPDSEIGNCKHTVTAADLASSKILVVQADCVGGVDSVTFNLVAKP